MNNTFDIWTEAQGTRVLFATGVRKGSEVLQHVAVARQAGLKPIIYSARDGARIWV